MTNIDDNVPMPEPVKRKRGRPRKDATSNPNQTDLPGHKSKAASPAASLLNALRFICVAQRKAGPTNVQFCNASHHWVAASDGIVTAAHPIQEDIQTCPQTHPLIEALSTVAQERELSITQLTPHALAITSGAFRGLISCVAPAEIPITGPDPTAVQLNPGQGVLMQHALASVASLAVDGSPEAIKAGVYLQAKSAVATDGAALLECWHGVDLPGAVLMPRYAAIAVGATKHALIGLGASASSVTFHFQNGAWLKTQLYAERYPNYQHFFDTSPGAKVWAAPLDFFKAIDTIESFSKTGTVHFNAQGIASDSTKEQASTYRVEGLPDMAFKAKLLLSVKHAFETAAFDPVNRKVVFYNNKARIRGVVMAVDLTPNQPAQSQPSYKTPAVFSEDEIPF